MKINSPLSHRSPEPEKSVLYIVGTPIGNLEDISKRAINILKNVSLIACEDTRKTHLLMKYLGISNKLICLNQHNSFKKSPHLISRLKDGDSIAIVSDAGMPLISDPGHHIVSEVKKKNYDVICIPGPCAAITALVSSGLDSSRFIFYGFLPRSGNERSLTLKEISNNELTSIIYESPKRILKLLRDLKTFIDQERNVVLAKELTKRYEKHYGNTIDQIIHNIEISEPKGEFTLIISGYKNQNKDKLVTNQTLRNDLQDLIKAGLSHSSASSFLSKQSGKSKNEIYKLLIKME